MLTPLQSRGQTEKPRVLRPGVKKRHGPFVQSLAVEKLVAAYMRMTVSGLFPLRPPPGIPGEQEIEMQESMQA